MGSRYLVPEYIKMSPHTGRKHNANNQNKTNTSTQNKQGKGKSMPNAGKKTKTVQHTTENDNNAFHTENDINANNTGIKPIDASSKKNGTKTMTRQEKRRCTENKNEQCTSTNKIKKLKLIRITETSDVSEEEEVDNFEGFHEIN